MSKKTTIGIMYGIIMLKEGDDYKGEENKYNKHVDMQFSKDNVFKSESAIKIMAEEMRKDIDKKLANKGLLKEEYFGYAILSIDLEEDPQTIAELTRLRGYIKGIETFPKE